MKSPLHYTFKGRSKLGKEYVARWGSHWIAMEPPSERVFCMSDHVGPFIPAVALGDTAERSGIWVSLTDDINFHITPHQ